MRLLKKLTSVLILLIILSSFSCVFAEPDKTEYEALGLYAPTILLMESKTGKVLYEKNGYEKTYPASTTKIMTAILVLENCKDLSEKTTASYDAIYTVPWDYSNANIQVGEELTINQLLNVLLIESANEAANILAEYIAGSVDSFATMMNTKASEIGCQNTHFVNANGVHNENHYSTAYDLALMGRYALQNETFRKIITTSVYTLPATNKYNKNDRVFGNRNLLVRQNDSDEVDNYYYEYATGIKTGYTSAAKNCVVASAKKDDVEYIAVVLGANTTENGLQARFLDCKALFNYAFDNYSIKTLHEENSVLKSVRVKKASLRTRNLNALVKDEITVVVKNGTDLSSINPKVEINEDLTAPIAATTTIGKITYNINGLEYTSDLIAANDVDEFNFLHHFLLIAGLVFVLYILYRLVNGNSSKKRNKKKKRAKSKDTNYIYW